MTTLRKHAQRRYGKLNAQPISRHNELRAQHLIRAAKALSKFASTLSEHWQFETHTIEREQFDKLVGMDQERSHPNTVVVSTADTRNAIEQAIDESTPFCRTTKSGAPNKQDLKREMRKRGYVPGDGFDEWVAL